MVLSRRDRRRWPFKRLLHSALLLFSCLVGTMSEASGLAFNQDETAETYQPPARVKVEPFILTLVGSARALKPTELDNLLAMMEKTVSEYAREQRPPDGGVRRRNLQAVYSELKWIKFNDVTQEFERPLQSIHISVGAGIFSYAGYPIPTEEEANTWIHTSLENSLMKELEDSTTFSAINNAYIEIAMDAPADTTSTDSSPADEGGGGGGEEEEEPISAVDSKSTSGGAAGSNNKVPVIAGSVVGAAVLLALAALFAVKIHRKNQAEIEDLRRSPRGGSSGSAVYTNGDEVPQRHGLDDGRSFAGSESDWTVATEAGDSTALKSIYAKSSKLGQSADHNNEIRMTLSESFERDRQVAISKDMLTGMWSGAVQRGGRNDNAQSESVLKPSHFSASQERRVRRAAASSNNSSPALESSSISSDEAEDAIDLVFEQADAWDSLPSPARTSKSRTHRSRRDGKELV